MQPTVMLEAISNMLESGSVASVDAGIVHCGHEPIVPIVRVICCAWLAWYVVEMKARREKPPVY